MLKVSPSVSVGAGIFNDTVVLSSACVDVELFATGSSFVPLTLIVCVALASSPDGSVTV